MMTSSRKPFWLGNVTQYCLDKYAKGNRIIGHIYQLEREGQELIVKAHPERKKDNAEEKEEILRLIQVRTHTGEPQLYLLHSSLSSRIGNTLNRCSRKSVLS
jgi:hypothetical protein